MRAFPGVRALAQRLHDAGHVLVIASSAPEEELEKLLGLAGIKDLLTDATSSDDVERSKPDPDIVHAAIYDDVGTLLAEYENSIFSRG